MAALTTKNSGFSIFAIKSFIFSALFIALSVTNSASTDIATKIMLEIVTTNDKHTFISEYAATPETRSKGLMGRPPLSDKRGMLFDFHDTIIVQMWMANTPSPLDMLFITSDGLITHIAKNTRPNSYDIISSSIPVRFLLEIRGNHADELGIKVGNRVNFEKTALKFPQKIQ